MTQYECAWCNKMFTTKYNLIVHENTAKYCIEQRETRSLFSCNGCDKKISTMFALKRHTAVCKDAIIFEQDRIIQSHDFLIIMINASHTLQSSKLEEEIESLNLEHKRLTMENEKLILETKATIYEKEYLAIRDKPTKTNNITTNNGNVTTNKLKQVNISTIDPFTIETVQARLDRGEYSYEMFRRGLPGLKDFLLGIITKDTEKSYVTTDKSRSNFHRLQENRQWTGDAGALFLTQVFDIMEPLIGEYWARAMVRAPNIKGDELEQFSNGIDELKLVSFGISHGPTSDSRRQLIGDVIREIKTTVAL